MKKVLIKVYDHEDYLTNILVPLSMDYHKIIYISHCNYKKRYTNAIINILNKHNIESEFKIIVNDDVELDELLNSKINIDIDISSAKYLSLVIFEKSLKTKHRIIYFDNEEVVIKDYRSHSIIKKELYALNIKEIIESSGAILTNNMHTKPNLKYKSAIDSIIRVVDKCLNIYPIFTNYIANIAQTLTNDDCLELKLDQEKATNLKNNPTYKILNQESIINIQNNTLSIKNHFFYKMLKNAGSWLESYVYIKLKQANVFDDVEMSSIIEFKDNEIRQAIACEIDIIAIKDNRLVLISCKSNKVSTEAINEIKVHNDVFGNYLSKAVVCTIEDLNVKNPIIYKKAKELEVAIVDVSMIKMNKLAETIEKIMNNTYQYERI